MLVLVRWVTCRFVNLWSELWRVRGNKISIRFILVKYASITDYRHGLSVLLGRFILAKLDNNVDQTTLTQERKPDIHAVVKETYVVDNSTLFFASPIVFTLNVLRFRYRFCDD